MVTERRVLERVTASDLFLLLWDDYGWSSDIGGLAVLDGATLLDPDGRIEVEAVRRHVASRLHLVPRFRQLLVRPRLGLGWPLWVDAPAFDLADHIRVSAVAPPGNEASLLRACQDIVRRPLDPTRPLWELWLLSGLAEGRVGALLRLHHVLADGTAALAAFGALLDPDPVPTDPAPPAWAPTVIPTTGELLRDNVHRRRQELARGLASLTHPRTTLRRSRATLPAWREVLTERPAPPTSLNRPVGGDRLLATVHSRLDVAKQIAVDHGARVNDVVLAAVAGGLRELLTSRGEDVDGLVQRAMVTLSGHQDPSAPARGNKPGWMMVPLPVGEPDPVRRLRRIAAETSSRRNRARPEAGSGVFRFVAGQRAWYRAFPRQKSVNLVVSNVPGPAGTQYLAGARLLETFPMMPTMGNLTLVVAALSYAGQLNVTAAADLDGCPDVEVFARGVRDTLDALASSTLRPGRAA
jgi:diacylglycerol O-acyltransferase